MSNFLVNSYIEFPVDTCPVTVEDDYTSNLGYTKDGSSDWVLPTGGKIDFETVTRNTTAQFMIIDLQDSDYLNGSNLDDDNWTIRFGKFLVVNDATASGNIILHIACSNTTGDSGSTQQSLDIQINFNNNGVDGGYTAVATTGNLEGAGMSSGSLIQDMSDGSERWLQLERDGDDLTLKVYSDEFSTLVGSSTVSKAGISALRYLKFVNDSEQDQVPTASVELYGTLKIYNGCNL